MNTNATAAAEPERSGIGHRVHSPPMTRSAVMATIRDVLRLLELGPGSVDWSSAYHDYVALRFALFVQPARVRLIEQAFRALCNRHEWECLSVRGHDKSNEVSVIMHQSQIISTGPAGDRQMPHHDGPAAT